MQEYKRERNNLESRINEMAKQSKYHDEHLMIIDAWFSEVSLDLARDQARFNVLQLVDEIKILVGDLNNRASYSPFPCSLFNSDASAFKEHLKSRSSQISSAISQLFSLAPTSVPEMTEYQSRITQLLTSEKEHVVELEKSRLEKEKLEERLEDAAMRYMIAEKKLDRSKSATVARLEKQAVTGGRSESGSGLGGSHDNAHSSQVDVVVNGGERLADVEASYKESMAESNKRKEQLRSLEDENEKLAKDLTAMSVRVSHLTDEDYSKTDLFKQLKSQHEDVIKRINDLEATNIQLREEAERLQSERTAYRLEIERESEATIAEKEGHLAQAENDLARIRNVRDEYMADISMRKAAQAQERNSIDQVRELANAKDERVKALEAEVARLKHHMGQTAEPASPPASLDGLSTDELQSKCAVLEKRAALLDIELQSMGAAYKKASTLASQKVSNLAALEERTQRLSAEKVKADQKYFATMKVKEAREQEVRTLRAQNSKSSEMVSSLKDSESASRALQINLEKQIVEAKDSVSTITTKLRTANQILAERTILVDGLKTQVEELQKLLVSKDELTSAKSTAHRAGDVELEKLKVRLEETKKQLDTWKARSQGTDSDEYEMYRSVAICTVCRVNFKNTTMKTCGHVFCDKCVEERTTSRSRKCPNCNRAFGVGDVMRITL